MGNRPPGPAPAPLPPPPAQYLSGPSANVVVSLQTDSSPWQANLWYRNVCNGNETSLLPPFSSDISQNETKNFSVALTTGIYEFILYGFDDEGTCC